MTRTFISTYAEGNFNGYDTLWELSIDPEKIDKRWLDLFLKAGEKNWANDPLLVFLILSCSGVESDYSRKALKGYMEEIIKKKQLPYSPLYIYITDRLMESGLPQRFELLTASLENNKYPTYDSEIYRHISEAAYLKDFPPEYSDRFLNLYKKTNGVYYLDISGKIEKKPGKLHNLINKIINT